MIIIIITITITINKWEILIFWFVCYSIKHTHTHTQQLANTIWISYDDQHTNPNTHNHHISESNKNVPFDWWLVVVVVVWWWMMDDGWRGKKNFLTKILRIETIDSSSSSFSIITMIISLCIWSIEVKNKQIKYESINREKKTFELNMCVCVNHHNYYCHS
mgnify:FL=1